MLALLAPAPAPASAADAWVVATVASHHHERERRYNENNLGLGLEYRLNRDWYLAAGIYQNSYYDQSGYFGAGYRLFTPYETQDARIDVGLVGLLLTGYTRYKVDYVVMPAIAFEYKRFGVNLAPFAPGVLIGLQLKWRL